MRMWSLLFAATVFVLASAVVARAGDREIAEVIAGKLQESGQLQAYDIRVKVQDGIAWLRGRVTNERQMNAAVALAAQTEGIEQVANGLTIRAGHEPRPAIAPIASRHPVTPAVQQARLVPQTVIPATTRVAPPSMAVTQTPIAPSALQQPAPQLPPPTSVVVQDHTPPESLPIEEPDISLPVRNLEFSASLEALPSTVQKACYWSATGQMHVMDLHMVTTLTGAGAAELMLLPDNCDASAGEAFASDGSEGSPTSPLASGEDRSGSFPPDTSTVPAVGEQTSLIQTMPEPTPRNWAGSFRQRGMPTMRAVVNDQP